MITASQFRDKATLSIMYLILYVVLGAYLLFTQPNPITIGDSTKVHKSGQSLVFDSKRKG